MSYAIRLTERRDGFATPIDGMYVALSSVAASRGSPVTSDAAQAMRFDRPEDAAGYAHALDDDKTSCSDPVKRLMGAYATEIVPLQPLPGGR